MMLRYFFLVLIVGIGFVSCQKEVIVPPNPDVEIENGAQSISLYGEWVLLDAKMYMENLETGKKIVYNHFDSVKTVSSLRFSGAEFPIEVIERDSTVWTFIKPIGSYGEFLLNRDSLDPYGLYVTQSNYTIVEHPSSPNQKIGGSSRPLRAYIKDYNKKEVNFYIQTAYESIDGYNWEYFSELTFKKQ